MGLSFFVIVVAADYSHRFGSYAGTLLHIGARLSLVDLKPV